MSLGRWGNFSDGELTDLLDVVWVYFMEIPESPSESSKVKLEEEIAWELAVRGDLDRAA